MENDALTSLTGLDNLTSIGGNLGIRNNNALTSLTGLEGLTSIGGFLDISHNAALTSLTGLDSIDAGSITNLYIFNNPTLTTCEVQSICDYLVSPNGTIEIHDNAPGCNTQEEVEAACLIGVDEKAETKSRITIYPNPTATTIAIELPGTITVKNTILAIYSINGQQLISRQIIEPTTVVDVSILPQGVYVIKVTDDRTVQVGKIIKQ